MADEGSWTSSRLNLAQKVVILLTFVSLLVISLLPMIPGLTDYPYVESTRPGEPDEPRPLQQDETQHKDRYEISRDWEHGTAPQRREYFWTIEDTEHNPDGVFRPMMLINNQFPGPMIEVNEDDMIVVKVENKASNATSIHWHGMYQRGTPWMDGTVGISNCPIAPGGQFTYEFNVTGQAGSYFYHAHHGVQAADGLYGPLIIHERHPLDRRHSEYASDHVLMVADHYYDPSNALLMDYLQPDAENAEPVPAVALINGLAVRDCEDLPERHCDNHTSNVKQPYFHLSPNDRHRLRIIHTGAFAEMQVSLDQHEFAIVEVDGVDTVPVHYDRLNIHPAQRYSIVVEPNVTTQATQFWLRVKMLSTCFAEPNPETEAETRAIMSFAPEPVHELPQSIDWALNVDMECRDMDTSGLVPARKISAPEAPDKSFYLRSNFEIGAYRLSRGVFNTSSWRANVKSPSLHRSVEGLRSKNTSFTGAAPPTAYVNDNAFDIDRELVIQSAGSQIIDLVISNFDDGSHSMHLHGHKFWVLAQGHGYPPDNLTETLDLSNPLRRDTATVEAFGWMLMRFVADNPGAWAFHCHVSWHAEAGLMMQFLTMTDELATMEIPDTSRHLCGASITQLERGMSPSDETWYYE